MQAVLRYLKGDEFSYTESPSPAAENLDGFLFDAKSGYCQQYSGAMALLLRMAGIPARVVDGLHHRACWTARPASSSCATSTPTPGWRSGTPATAG